MARLDSDGDVLLAGPAIRAAAGAGEVVLLCGPAGVRAAELLPGVDRIIEWQCPWITNPAPEVRPIDIEAVIALVHGIRADVALVLTSFHQSPLPLALMLRLAGVPRIVARSTDYPGSLLDVRLTGDQHAPCRDSRARDCPIPGHPCLDLVEPADVVAAVAEVTR